MHFSRALHRVQCSIPLCSRKQEPAHWNSSIEGSYPWRKLEDLGRLDADNTSSQIYPWTFGVEAGDWGNPDLRIGPRKPGRAIPDVP